MCLDTFIGSSGTGIDIRQFDDETNPQLATCDDSEDGKFFNMFRYTYCRDTKAYVRH